MISELKRVVQPHLREIGFDGSFPHYRRMTTSHIDLVTFQFDQHGGGFILEIARCQSDGVTTTWGEKIAPPKCKAWDVHPNYRVRVKQRSGSGTDAWFRFDRDAPPMIAGEVLSRLKGIDWTIVPVGNPRSKPEL